MRKSRFTESQIVAILKEGEAGVSIDELTGKHKISRATYFNWRGKYGGVSVSELRAHVSLGRQCFRRGGPRDFLNCSGEATRCETRVAQNHLQVGMAEQFTDGYSDQPRTEPVGLRNDPCGSIVPKGKHDDLFAILGRVSDAPSRDRNSNSSDGSRRCPPEVVTARHGFRMLAGACDEQDGHALAGVAGKTIDIFVR